MLSNFFHESIKRLKENRFLMSILMVSGGTMFSQAFTTITTPIVTRTYTTEQYGILTTFNSVLSILGIAGALKYEMSIPIAKDESEAHKCYRLSVITLLITTAVIFVGISIDGRDLLGLIGAENLYDYRYFIPIGIFLVQYFAIVIQYAYRQKNFKKISLTSIKQSCIGNITKIFLGFLNVGPIGLLLSRIMSDSVGAFSLSKPLLYYNSKNDGPSIRETAIRYKKFPLFQFPSTIVGQLTLNLPVFFFGKMYSDSVIGSFGLANIVVNLSMDLVGKSVGNVFYAEAAKIAKTNPRELKNLSNSIIKKMTILGLVPLLILVFFGRELFGIVFGQAWELSGTFASILSIGIFISFVFTPISRVFEIYEIQIYGLAINVCNLTMSFVVFFVAKTFGFTIYATLIGYTIIKSIISIVTFFVSRHFINKRIIQIEDRVK